MSTYTITTSLDSWLKNRTKSELISIIMANCDRIEIFRDRRQERIGQLEEELWAEKARANRAERRLAEMLPTGGPHA